MYKLNDIVYYINPNSGNCHKAMITKIESTGVGFKYAELEDLTIPGTTECLLGNLFKTEEGCNEHIQKETLRVREAYLKQITQVEDLVRFMYSHHVSCCGEYTDFIARDIVKEKSKELLGIELS